jgi:hypothetical protein
MISSKFVEPENPANALLTPVTRTTELRTQTARGIVAWSALVFAILQSVCTFFAAVDGLRLAIGIGSLAFASNVFSAIDRFHLSWLRVPMITFAVVGSLLNLVILWQVRRLRRRPSAQWRQRPATRSKLRAEQIQLVLAIFTLLLIVVEERQHLIWLKHL